MLVILDTSPLITLAGFIHNEQSALEYLLTRLDIRIGLSTAQEATANLAYPDARHIQELIQNQKISVEATPQTAQDEWIDRYQKLGIGERDAIRLALTYSESRLVLDDYLACVIAGRFGIRPIILLDLLIELSIAGQISVQYAQRLVQGIAGRYSSAFVEHTLHQLRLLT